MVESQITLNRLQIDSPKSKGVNDGGGHNELFEGGRRTYYEADKSDELESTLSSEWTHF